VACIADGQGSILVSLRIKPRINKQCIKVVGLVVTGPAISQQNRNKSSQVHEQ